MTIELLYVRDCPNHAPARQAVQDVLQEIGLDVSINELEIALIRIEPRQLVSSAPRRFE